MSETHSNSWRQNHLKRIQSKKAANQRDQQRASRQDIAKVIRALDHIADAQVAKRNQGRGHETRTGRREGWTLVGLVLAALIVLAAVAVTHWDAMRLIDDARIAADRQHADTANALLLAAEANANAQHAAAVQHTDVQTALDIAAQ